MNNSNKYKKALLVAPSGQIGNIKKIEQGIEYINSLGFETIFSKHLFDVNRYMAGTDIDRANDINEAFCNTQIDTIFCVRASAGSTRILPHLNYETIKKYPKHLVGFCDNGAIQIALNTLANIISFAGFVITYDFKDGTLDEKIKTSLEKLLNHEKYAIFSGEKINSGIAKGKLICCNLTTLLYLAGTPYFPNLSGKILLIEDVHEKLYRIDLKLQQLKQLPHFDKLQGIILGEFTNCESDEEDGTLEDTINDFMKNITIPAVKNFEFGHTKSRYVLPLGAEVELNANSCSLKILQY